ncbi:MAG: type I DNA topoisomerase [Spirochaetaceae bacterium]|nr:type I DNA topoisomerase [Spirochaetaceae bacterium]
MGDKNILIIVESPTKAKTIKKFLPPNCTVIASNGHIRDLDKAKSAVDIENKFKPHYIIPPEKKALVKKLKDELKETDYLLLATDEDREGESISWHLLQVLKPKVDYKRMVFHEITKRAILKGLESGKDLDYAMVDAQEARRLVDRLFGYDVSSLVGEKLSSRKLSAGRVQSPGLMLTVEREKQRILFKKSTYFDAKATLDNTIDKTSFESKLVRYKDKGISGSKSFDSVTGEYKNSNTYLLLDEKGIDSLLDSLKNKPFVVDDIVSRPITSKPGSPFITSTLQQEAIKKLHFSSKETMRVAQKLYESGLITYMRTDSPYLSNEGITGARNTVEHLYGHEFLSPSPRQFKSESHEAQEAHEAIRPSGEDFITPGDTDLSGRELQLYTLIWSRTIASQMAEAKKKTTTVKITCGDALFQTSGTQIVFAGYLRAYVEGKDDPEAALDDTETLLPELKVGQSLNLISLDKLSHETKAPARFTEASLIHDLEEKGIGRPSTYASIIDTLLTRQYLIKEGSALVPTFVGFAVCNYLMSAFPRYVDYDFTRRLESELDSIAKQKKDKLELLEEFYLGENGLQAICMAQKKADNKQETKTLNLPQIDEANPIMIGPFGPYVLGKEVDGKREFINLPKEYLPGTITDDVVKALIKEGKTKYEPLVLGQYTDGQDVLLCEGRFGPYWQVGHENKNKPKRSSVPSWMQKTDEAKDFNNAIKYLSLPRDLGQDDKGNTIVATKGKYGPFVNCDGVNANLNRRDHDSQLFTIAAAGAMELLKVSKSKSAGNSTASKGALKDFGEIDGDSVKLYHGRYGFYLKHGKTNIKILDEAAQNDEELAKALKIDQIKESIEAKKSKKK